MKENRPINLNLLTIEFPLPAIISILHRVTGVVIFLYTPCMLIMLHYSLASQAGFDKVQAFSVTMLGKCLIFILCASVWFHLVAGIRHLLMDLGVAETLRAARMSSGLTLIITVFLTMATGFWLW